MKREMLCVALLCLIGCGSGTDVGNPVEASAQSTTTRDDYLGTYGASTALASPGDSDVQATTVATCSTQTGTTPAIDAGTGTTAVLLTGIFNYASITDPVAGTVTSGVLAIDVNGISTRLQCTGTLSLATLSLTCNVITTSGTSPCALTLEQQ